MFLNFSNSKKQILPLIAGISIFILAGNATVAQENNLVNTTNSPYAKLTTLNLGDVTWTNGFWADRFAVCKKSMFPDLLKTYMDKDVSHAFANFQIAAGEDTGSHSGPPFHDGDFYKLLEAATALYAVTKDKDLDIMLDTVIAVIAKAQREDGYIHTPTIIAAKKDGKTKEFEDRLNFETYNLGHLMTAACIHYRVTGKENFLNIAKGATKYLQDFYNNASPELARNAICPSHYMGIIEMYRTTGNKEYLTLAKNLIDIRGEVKDGTDQNQDREPFRQQTKAMGHAVRANYLYAGVADVYAETGDDSLVMRLEQIWDNLVNQKMYITGACGALYDGLSPDGTSYEPPYIQDVHQAYGRDYQLPNRTAHNETCANIGNVLFNWRMLQITGQAKYADVVELALYNSVLSGISLDGDKFFYTNPLSASDSFPYDLRWSGGRVPYIALSNCCPPNVVRTIAEVNSYAYSLSKDGLYVNIYGGNKVNTKSEDGAIIRFTQETDYPWNGKVVFTMEEMPAESYALHLRIPEWCSGARLLLNGKLIDAEMKQGSYVRVKTKWKKGDKLELNMPMEAKLMEGNPEVEDIRNEVAVKRGPIVYCLESKDMPKGTRVFDVAIPKSIDFTLEKASIDNAPFIALSGDAEVLRNKDWNSHKLYREIPDGKKEMIPVTLIPYYAWANRGHSEMTVWLPVSR